MSVPHGNGFWLVMSAALSAMAPTLAAAQSAVEEPTVLYEREVFRYGGAGRVDPFRSLVKDGDLGVRIEDLTLRGVVHHSDPAQSVAVLALEGSDRRIRARVGERMGSLRILAIEPDRVEIVIEELGVARRETLRMERPQSEERSR